MAKSPIKSSLELRKSDGAVDRIAGSPLLPKPIDPRQAGLFDQPLPKWIKPCLPTLVDKPPVGPNWVHEIKWDGYRVSVSIFNGAVMIRTRNGHDWTTRFPSIAEAAGRLSLRSAVIDGEAVILDEEGRSSFAELQADLDRHGSRRAVLYAFDLLYLDGEDLRGKPLEDRRMALSTVASSKGVILYSGDFTGPGADLFEVARKHGLEGIVSKRIDKPYRSGRRTEWLKTKCVETGRFVIIGYQPGSGAVRTPIANIKIATFDGQTLRYAGAVGAGFNETGATALRKRLDAIVTSACALRGLKGKGAVWVSPDLQAEIAYRGMTRAGELRHASFKGLAEAPAVNL